MNAVVSAVIPTLGGPGLRDAVASCLGQSGVAVEVIVVYNGTGLPPSFDDPRVRVMESPPALRGNGARSAGINAACGKYIALLDDDDSWAPAKLRVQLDLLERMSEATVASCWVSETDDRRVTRIIGAPHGGPIDDVRDFLFVRRGLRPRRNQLQTSTLIGRAEVMRSVQFDPAISFHQDWSWILKQADAGTRFVQVGEPLVNRRISGVGSVSKSITFQQSAEWARKHLRTRRQLGDFFLVMVLPKAVRSADRRAARKCLGVASREGLAGPYAWTLAGRETLKLARNLLKKNRRPE